MLNQTQALTFYKMKCIYNACYVRALLYHHFSEEIAYSVFFPYAFPVEWIVKRPQNIT